ncbi:hypothetical protein Plec18167_008891 [Paecilomyces lecythidis]|uniref:Uncharacterized protein n=1 Tax=Paecilomyces lecythidis TaxID=3004212 RepID=A0ABR3WTF1_9EURO
MEVRSFPEYNPERIESSVERAQSLELFLGEYLAECGAQRPEIDYNVFEDSGWCYKDVADYKFQTLWEYDPPRWGGCIPQWSVQSIYHYQDQRLKPHLKSTMISDWTGQNELIFRGELIALVRMIRGRLATPGLAHYAIHPALLFSIMGPQQARMLQGHMDGAKLVIQRSELYDFRHEDVDVLYSFAQWFLSSPVGNTEA